MGRFRGSGGRRLVWFGHVRMDIESVDIGSDEVEGGLGFWWDIDAQFECGLQEVLIDLVLGLVESQNHDAIGFIVILLDGFRIRIRMLHVRNGPLLGGRHCRRTGQQRALVGNGINCELNDEVHDGFVASV